MTLFTVVVTTHGYIIEPEDQDIIIIEAENTDIISKWIEKQYGSVYNFSIIKSNIITIKDNENEKEKNKLIEDIEDIKKKYQTHLKKLETEYNDTLSTLQNKLNSI